MCIRDRIPTEPSLNSRLLYNDNFFNQLIQTTVAYETASGTIAQQEFTYLEVNPGQGVYTVSYTHLDVYKRQQ